jgi:hypothetical protein
MAWLVAMIRRIRQFYLHKAPVTSPLPPPPIRGFLHSQPMLKKYFKKYYFFVDNYYVL